MTLETLGPPIDAAALSVTLGPLFERAPRFIARLVAGAPYPTWEALFGRASAIAHAMPESEQIELIDAHPRLGAPPGSVSAHSFGEQGYDAETADAASGTERVRISAELASLNDAYETRFGFRYCVFVAGRPRSALLALMAEALGADRTAELHRALGAVVAIARDRQRRSTSVPEARPPGHPPA